MTRRLLQAGALLTILWAGIYLPGLGTPEFKGEEARRVLPAIHMLDSGDWLVPRLAGAEYYKKPPLINWAVASSMLATGRRDECSARLPSAVAVLALGLTLVGVGSVWLGMRGAFLASVFAVTNLGILEKGRLIEIEAVYVSLFGVALVCWMALWLAGRSPWLVWTVPHFFLGLGLLTKGPLHLLFFYLTIALVLWRAGRLRDLLAPAHLCGLMIMGVLFAAWFVPYLREVSPGVVLEKWSGEMGSRFGSVDGSGRSTDWLWNVPRGLSNYLPWILFLPALWSSSAEANLTGRDLALLRGVRLALVLGFFGLSVFPGVAPRYTLPLIVPASLLLGQVLAGANATAQRLRSPWRIGLLALAAGALAAAVASAVVVRHNPAACLAAVGCGALAALLLARASAVKFGVAALAFGTAAAIALLTAQYALAVAPRMRARGKSRPLATSVRNALPPEGARLWGVAPGFHPFLCYLPAGTRYVKRLKELPADAVHLLLRADTFAREKARGIALDPLLRFRGQDRPPSGGPPPELVVARLARARPADRAGGPRN